MLDFKAKMHQIRFLLGLQVSGRKGGGRKGKGDERGEEVEGGIWIVVKPSFTDQHC